MPDSSSSPIVALAGRRIDAEGASDARFPLAKVAAVRERLTKAFRDTGATALVCAAACGADLIALEVAGELGVRRRIVLPTNVEAFRAGSVVDRPGDWGAMFDRIVAEVAAQQDLLTLELGSGDVSYRAANRIILDEAQKLGEPVEAWIVWNGKPRDESDITLNFADEAWARSLPLRELLTIPRSAGAQPDYQKTCFVAMPFGLKPNGEPRNRQIDFDAIYSTIIAPAIESTELPEGGRLRAYRTDRDPAPALIDDDMWKSLELSRMTFCDLTCLNFNVGIELGVRYRCKGSCTVAFRQPATTIAFDIAQVKVFDYDPLTPAAAREAISNTLSEALKQNRIDSPVQRVIASVIATPRTPEVDKLLKEGEQSLCYRDTGTARLKYLAASQLNANDATIWLRLATVEGSAGRWHDAERSARRATELMPDYSEAWREYGVAQNQLHRRDAVAHPVDGVDSLRRAAALNPNDFDALASLGGAFKRQNKLDEALAAYQASLNVSDQHPYPLLNVLKLEAATTGQLDLQRYKSAIKRATRIRDEQRAENCDMPWSLFDSIELSLYQGRGDNALDLLDEAVEQERGSLMTFYESLSILQDKGIELDKLDDVLARIASALPKA